MSKKTYRVKLNLDGDPKNKIYRTDGRLTALCSAWDRGYYCWEKSTKYNDYQGWAGYVSSRIVENSLKEYNPDNLTP